MTKALSEQLEDLTLEEKLALIDKTMKGAQERSDESRKSQGLPPIPVDPADLTICDGCT